MIDTTCDDLFLRFCSDSCKNRNNRQNYRIRQVRQCVLCHEEFEPTTSRQKRCDKDHYRSCDYCSEPYVPVILARHLRELGYCDNICSTLAQFNTEMPSEKLHDFKNIDTWAKGFAAQYERKPTKDDVKVYFGVDNLPPRADQSLFHIGRSSYLETIVEYYLAEHYPQVRFRKVRQKFDIGYREIDIFLEDFNIGFEVQDFASHSRASDHEPSRYGTMKNGPAYHAEKITLYAERGITVIELWEDEIRDGTFQKIVDDTLHALPNLYIFSELE